MAWCPAEVPSPFTTAWGWSAAHWWCQMAGKHLQTQFSNHKRCSRYQCARGGINKPSCKWLPERGGRGACFRGRCSFDQFCNTAQMWACTSACAAKIHFLSKQCVFPFSLVGTQSLGEGVVLIETIHRMQSRCIYLARHISKEASLTQDSTLQGCTNTI